MPSPYLQGFISCGENCRSRLSEAVISDDFLRRGWRMDYRVLRMRIDWCVVRSWGSPSRRD